MRTHIVVESGRIFSDDGLYLNVAIFNLFHNFLHLFDDLMALEFARYLIRVLE